MLTTVARLVNGAFVDPAHLAAHGAAPGWKEMWKMASEEDLVRASAESKTANGIPGKGRAFSGLA